MTELSPRTPGANTGAQAKAAAVSAPLNALHSCGECVGTGGWHRYEPALAPAPGMLYLSCLHCRGSGRLALPRG